MKPRLNMPIYVENNNNTKKIDEFYINDNIIRSVLKGYIGIEGLSKIFYQKNNYNDIPEGYTKIPYILNDYEYGNYYNYGRINNVTYINTGIKGYKTIELKAESTSELGVLEKQGPHPVLYINNYYFIYFRSFQHSYNKIFHYYSSSPTTSSDPDNYTPFFGEYYLKNNKYYAETKNSHNYSLQTVEEIAEGNEDIDILLLGIPENVNFSTNNYRPGQQLPNTKLYYCKIYEDSTKTKLLRDFIPVRRDSDGRLGLFDLVSRTFFDNTFPNNSNKNFILNDTVRSKPECPSYAVCHLYDSCSTVHIFYPNDCYTYIPCNEYKPCDEYIFCNEYDSSIPESCFEYNSCDLYNDCEEYIPCEEHELCKAYGCNKYYYCSIDSCSKYDYCDPYDTCSVLNEGTCHHVPCINYYFCSELAIPCGTYVCSSYDFSPNKCEPYKVGESDTSCDLYQSQSGDCLGVSCSGVSCSALGPLDPSCLNKAMSCTIVTCVTVVH